MDAHIFQMKLTARMLKSQAKKCKKTAAQDYRKGEIAAKKGLEEEARAHVECHIFHMTQSQTCIKLACKLEATATRMQTGAHMQRIVGSIAGATKSLEVATQKMDLMQISQIMEKFDGGMENLEVKNVMLTQTMTSATASQTPGSQVDELLQKIGEAHNIEWTKKLNKLTVPTSKENEISPDVPLDTNEKSKIVEDQNDLVRRLNNLHVVGS